MDHYAVFGYPIKHSLSPVIHQAFAESLGHHLIYEKKEIAIADFPEAVASFFASGGRGLNVTLPFKEVAFNLAKKLSVRAERAGAVNTLCLAASGELYGDNTDGSGLVRDLCVNHQQSLKNKNIFILGAGGAVRGILEPILLEAPKHVFIYNRTREKASSLVDFFGSHFSQISLVEAEQLADFCRNNTVDYLINGTSMGVVTEEVTLPFSVLPTDLFCYDLVYSRSQTGFLKACQSMGAEKGCDGLGMLVEQAAEAFLLWRGVRPETQPVIEQLRASFS
jgi:shikimate dehydrogenase